MIPLAQNLFEPERQHGAAGDASSGRAAPRSGRLAVAGLAALTVVVALLSGCWSGGGGSPANPSGSTTGATGVSVGVAVSGLASGGLVLANGNDSVGVASGATTFSFPTAVPTGASYAVTVATQPAGETCSVSDGTGVAGDSDVSTVQVACAATAYTVGGTISGLAASGLVLANGGDTVSPATGASSFLFATPVATGGSYSVTVQEQPTGLTCSVAGTFPAVMGSANVTSIAVTCAAQGAFAVLAGQLNCPAGSPGYSDGTGATASIPVPQALGMDASGNLFVTGQGANVVQKISPDGVVTTFAGAYSVPGAAYVAPVDGVGTAARFDNPSDLAVDAAGNLYLADLYAVRKVTPAGVVSTLAGSATAGFVDGTGPAAAFDFIAGLALDASGNVIVGDELNSAIRKVGTDGAAVRLAGGGAGYTRLGGFADGSALSALFDAPEGVAVDAAGTVYVADHDNNAIRRVGADGTVTTLAGGGPDAAGFADGTGTAARFERPTHVTLGADGTLYVLDQTLGTPGSAIRKVTAAGVVTTLAIAPGYVNGSAANPPASLTLPGRVESMLFDSHGNLYVGSGCAVVKAVLPR